MNEPIQSLREEAEVECNIEKYYDLRPAVKQHLCTVVHLSIKMTLLYQKSPHVKRRTLSLHPLETVDDGFLLPSGFVPQYVRVSPAVAKLQLPACPDFGLSGNRSRGLLLYARPSEVLLLYGVFHSGTHLVFGPVQDRKLDEFHGGTHHKGEAFWKAAHKEEDRGTGRRGCVYLQSPNFTVNKKLDILQNGDADAITVESGNVYKASLHPYNLKPILAESFGPQKETCYYAVAVVRKSSTFKFSELKNKRSCHTGIGTMAGWYSPLRVLQEKKLLNWTIEETQRAVSKYFSASCVPGASEPNLCKQCTGRGSNKCKPSNDEPYYSSDGALKCLRDNKGDVAFVAHAAIPAELSKNFQLLCPDNTRKPIDQYQQCNLAHIPVNAVVTRSAGDKTSDIVAFFQNAQKKGCKLSGLKYGKNLLLKNSAATLIPLPSALDAFLYLGASHFTSIQAMSVPTPTSKGTVRWCTQSKQEKRKCDDWTPASGGAIECTEASSADECILQVLKGDADAVTLDGGYLYTAGQCGLVPVMGEYYNQDDLKPCRTSGSKTQGTYYAVAVVKKSNKDISWNNLKGKMSCHTAVGRTAGWNIPVGLINKKNNNCDIGSYFSKSCAPGSDIDSTFCQLCVGDPQKTLTDTKCSPSDAEAYYGYSGAFRCLVERGDVAFVKHTTVLENTDGKNPAEWSKKLKSSDFELLCPDGSRALVSDYKTCNLAEVPAHAVITRPEKRNSVVKMLSKHQSLFGRNGIQVQKFQLFVSKEGKDLLFKDSTQCLLEIDQKMTMEDFLGKTYYSAVSSLNKCSTTSELLSACMFHSC